MCELYLKNQSICTDHKGLIQYQCHKESLMSPHKLRSNFAMSFYEASDRDILLLQKKLHHKSITMTNIYAKASDKASEESRNLLQGVRNRNL